MTIELGGVFSAALAPAYEIGTLRKIVTTWDDQGDRTAVPQKYEIRVQREELTNEMVGLNDYQPTDVALLILTHFNGAPIPAPDDEDEVRLADGSIFALSIVKTDSQRSHWHCRGVLVTRNPEQW